MRLAWLARLSRNGGVFPPMRPTRFVIRCLERLGLGAGEVPVPVLMRTLAHPLFLRFGTSDVSAFGQIILGKELEHFSIQGGDTIIDCGANIGCSSVYFLNRNRDCRVIAIEADPVNFSVLVRNLQRYRDRALPVLAAVTHEGGYVTIERCPDGGHWASHIGENPTSEGPVVPAITLETVLSWVPGKKVSLVKMDIEGAETKVLEWMRKHHEMFRGTVLAVELHNDSARAEFQALAALCEGACSLHGEYASITL